MRRVLGVILVLAAAAALTVLGTGASEPEGNAYTVELDNAFGLVTGADLKVAGVRAGKITDMRVDRRSKRALVDFEITKNGFGSLRADAFCGVRQQSLIGEYFIDCEPGREARKLKPGTTIPVERTSSTIPIDLINNVMRKPYRERLAIILNELGAAVAGRSADLNEAIRRAVPALRETNRVLDLLGDQNQVLKQLTTDADTVVGDLADNRRDVGRWVKETRETAAASAERRTDIAASLRRLPTFLRELRPTMVELGQVADAQIPSLTDLNASAEDLERLFKDLGPFAESTRVNFRSLAEASGPGRRAVKAAQPSVAQLTKLSENLPETAKNATFVLKDLDDRERAVERDPRSPEGKGYTGLESLLNYFFDQSQAINIFDRNGHILKINLFVSKCSEYQNPESLKEELKKDPHFLEDCLADLGPNQPGVTTPDPTNTGAREREQHHAVPHSTSKRTSPTGRDERGAGEDRRDGGKGDGGDGGDGGKGDDGPTGNPLRDVPKAIQEILNLPAPAAPQAPQVPELPQVPRTPELPQAPRTPELPKPGELGEQESDALLDFLFAP